MTNSTNILEIVDLVVARLRSVAIQALDEQVVTVEKMADFTEIEFSQWPAPSIYIVPGAISADSAAGDTVSVGLDVHAVVVVDNSSHIQGQDGPDMQAGTLGLAVIRALHNWYPDANHDSLVMRESPGSLDFAPGRLLFPLTFRTSTTVEGFFDPNH